MGSAFVFTTTAMSQFPSEADEAQHRHYNDGHFVNPYDQYDPFIQNSYPGPPPALPQQQPAYYVPPPPPLVNPFSGGVPAYSTSPSPAVLPGLSPSPAAGLSYPPPPRSPETRPASGASHSVPYSPAPPSAYEPQEEREGDDGDMPLLARPGPKDDVGRDEENVEESNVRYGRIPQRVPRRYKTLKRVEYVSLFFCF